MNGQDDKPVDFPKLVRRALFKSLIVPVGVLIFFLFAPAWLNQKLGSQITEAINRNENLTDSQKAERIEKYSHADFQSIVSDNPPAGFEKAHDNLVASGVRGNFDRLRWGLILSAALVLGLLAAVIALHTLNLRAGKSRDDLVSAYRTSWKIVIVAALANVFLLIPLLAYGTFELTVLLTDRYSPKLILVIVLGGLFALWRSVSILLKAVPLEFAERMSREVSPEDAPELWRAVRFAAERLHTAPPDRILIGLQLNFYVTEFAVKFDDGRTQGKTLFLSFPLMKILSEDEIMAIIGHELGHFIGEDTRLSREFYPFRFKVHNTMVTMAQSGWIGWPSFQLLNYFTAGFGQTEQATSRQRELLADQKAAELTSARTMASALIRFQVAVEAFQRGLKQLAGGGQQSILDLPLQSIIQEKLAVEPAFWDQLFKKKLPHPLDSHPSLHVRLEALGQPIDTGEARSIALATEPSAYEKWLANHPALFTGLAKQAETVTEKMRAVHADYQTAEGKQLLDKHFPEKKWQAKSGKWVLGTVLFLLAGFFVLMTLCISDSTGKWIFGILSLPCLAGLFFVWKTPSSYEITLNAQGINSTNWSRPLNFSDIARVSGRNQYGTITLTFHLKDKQPPFGKKPLFRIHSKKTALALTTRLSAKPLTVAQTILKYYQRVQE